MPARFGFDTGTDLGKTLKESSACVKMENNRRIAAEEKGSYMERKKHQRRPHYSGTHPKSYREKYKEHNPEKYADTIEKVIQKGSTCTI